MAAAIGSLMVGIERTAKDGLLDCAAVLPSSVRMPLSDACFLRRRAFGGWVNQCRAARALS